MLQVTVTFNDQTIHAEIPTCWDDVNFELYCKMAKQLNEPDLLCLLLGITPEILLKSKIQGLENIIAAINFTKTIPDIVEEPTHIGKIKIPESIRTESYDQYSCFEAILKKHENPLDLEPLAKYAAIYCQPFKNEGEEFDFEKAMYFAEELKKYPALEVISVGRFFLTKFVSIKTNLPLSYLRSITQTKKSRPGSKILAKLGLLIPRLTKWRVTLGRTMKSWLSGRSTDSSQS